MSKRRRNREKKKVLKPFCYYCDREFEDLRILIEHQKAKHFKCTHCSRRLVSVSGMITHVTTVHKAQVDSVPNAKEDRNQIDFDVVGMEGIPVEFLEEKYDGEIPEEIANLLPSLAHKRAKTDVPDAPSGFPAQQHQQQQYPYQAPPQPGIMGAAPSPHQPGFPMGTHPPMPPHMMAGGPPMPPGAPFGMPPPGHVPPFAGRPPFGMPPPPHLQRPPMPPGAPYGMPAPPFMPPPPQQHAQQKTPPPPAQPSTQPLSTSAHVTPSTQSAAPVIPTQQAAGAHNKETETAKAPASPPTSPKPSSTASAPASTTAPVTPTTTTTAAPPSADDYSIVMMYSDQDVSMEERRGSLSRYRRQKHTNVDEGKNATDRTATETKSD